MAGSVLRDRLGYVPQPDVVYEFLSDVVITLDPEFVLKFEEVDAWIDAHGSLFAENPRAQPIDLYAAGGA
jgi:hypothetical protein